MVRSVIAAVVLLAPAVFAAKPVAAPVRGSLDDRGVTGRKRISTAELEKKKWPAWPLSELAISLALPGRDFLERPFGRHVHPFAKVSFKP